MQKNELLAVLFHYNLIDYDNVSDIFKIVCPFHGDVNASLQVNVDENRFYCYGCGAYGDAKEFVKKMEGCNDLQAYIILERILRGKISQSLKGIEIPRQQIVTNKELLRIAKAYFYGLPKPSWEYIKKSYLFDRGYSAKTLMKIDARLNPNNNYGVIMPMMDMGKFKGYVCRATNKEVEKKRKYLYNKGFSRKDTIVGDYDRDWVIICEGYMDWLKFKEFGINNVCAILGWKITQNQIEKILSYTDCVISALDNTKTGRAGTRELRQYFEVVRFKFPENVKDPGDLDIYDFRKSWQQTVAEVKKRDKGIKYKNWR